MKTYLSAVAAIVALFALAAPAAQAAKPKTGKWKVTLVGAPKPPDADPGFLTVAKTKKGKLYIKDFMMPSHYTKCTGSRAAPVERNPGFSDTWGGGVIRKLGRGGGFSNVGKFSETRTQSIKGAFTSSRKASGTLRVRIADERACDSGELKWKASR